MASAAAAAAALLSLPAAAAYYRFSYPRMTLSTSSAKHAVGACRVRFRGSVAAQIYYPIIEPQSAAPSYPLFRPSVISNMASALSKPLLLFKLFGLDRASNPCFTTTSSRGCPPPPPISGEKKLPVIVFSHGLFGHCDVHTAISSQLAQQGYIVVVMEHEGGAASYCCDEESNTIHEYVVPPTMTEEQKSKGYDHFLELCRDFRRPMLEKREKEIERVIQCLRGETKDGMYPLQGDTGLPFMDDQVVSKEAKEAANQHMALLLTSLDPENLILAGHSFGAATAIFTLQSKLPGLRNAWKCCLLYDPWTECLDQKVLEQGLGDLPTFTLLSGEWPTNNFYRLTEQLLSPERTSRLVLATLPGTRHQWVADTPCWFPWWLSSLTKQTADMEPTQALRATVEASCKLLEKYDVTNVVEELERQGMIQLKVEEK
jgi:hypothetical protein